jgi:dTMP kinase
MLLVFEGIDGAGKTTQIQLLKLELERRGRRVIVVSNPHDSGIDVPFEQLTPSARIYAQLMCLQQLNDRIIYPAVSNDMADVLIDRGAYSIIAYQGYGEQFVGRALRITENNVPPYLLKANTILLAVPVEIAQQRAGPEDAELFSRENGRYMQRIVRGYFALASNHHWAVVQADQPASKVHQQIVRVVSQMQSLS